jgi:survival motor neuron protein
MDLLDDSSDDTLLIDAYQRSINKVNRYVEDLVNKDSDKEETTPQPPSPQLICTNRILGSKKQLEAIADKPSNSDDKSDHRTTLTNWKENDHCRAVWTEDGVEYEADISTINRSKGTCLIRFVGYDNVEVQLLTSLKPSLGKKSRQNQIKEAQQGQPNDVESTCKPEVTLPTLNQSQAETGSTIDDQKLFDSCPYIPLPPNQLLSSLGVEQTDEMLSAMMTSWYMCGFHTGRYVEAQRNKKQSS